MDSFKKSNLKIDAGTLTDSPLVQMIQTRLSQSGLTGKSLDNLRNEIINSVVKEYEGIVSDLGELVFQNDHQASEAIKQALKVEKSNIEVPKNQPSTSRSLAGRVATEIEQPYHQEFLNRISPAETPNNYVAGERLKSVATDIKEEIKRSFSGPWEKLTNEINQVRQTPQPQLANELETFINEHRGSLLLGESAPERRVLDSATRLLNVLAPEGSLRGVTLEELIKTKRTLADVANWEFYGSNYESAYKKLVGDIDRAIERTLEQEAPHLLEQYRALNAEYSAFKDFFENKNLKNLYGPKNENYYSLFNEFTTNPDKLKSLEDVLLLNPRSEEILNEIKRQFAENKLRKPNLTDRDLRNLREVLGPEFEGALDDYLVSRQYAEQHPGPRARQGQPLGIEVPQNRTSTNSLNRGKVKESPLHTRKKAYENLLNKPAEKIMKEFDTVEGIKKMKSILSLTPEGKELFKELSRYKIAEIIDEKLFDALTKEAKIERFPNILKTKKTRQIVKELLGKENYERLRRLQSNTKLLNESSSKFFNASKSGTTLIDAGLIGTAFTGVFTGNPFMAVPAILKIGGSYVLANLLSDPVFLKELETAMSTKNPKVFENAMKKISVRASLVSEKNRD